MSGGVRSVVVPLVVPQTLFDDWMSRLDLRVSKRLQLTQRLRLTGNFNIYNVFNASREDTQHDVWLSVASTVAD